MDDCNRCGTPRALVSKLGEVQHEPGNTFYRSYPTARDVWHGYDAGRGCDMTKCSPVFWFITGWASIFALKYVVIGLRQWDTLFHPERLVADTTGPWAKFSEPFMGMFSGGMSG